MTEEVLAGKVKVDSTLKKRAEKYVDEEKDLANVSAVLTGVK